MKKLNSGIPKGKLPNYTIGVISDEELYANSYARQMWGDYYDNEYDTGTDLTYGEACKKDFLAGVGYQKEKGFTYEQVELITNEMVNWVLDNVGSQNPESGKKFDEIVKKHRL